MKEDQNGTQQKSFQKFTQMFDAQWTSRFRYYIILGTLKLGIEIMLNGVNINLIYVHCAPHRLHRRSQRSIVVAEAKLNNIVHFV